MFILLSTLWSLWMLKYILFWIYLWQLKDYHIGRFIDHFRTRKGKRLIFNFVEILKLVLFVLFVIYSSLFVYLFYILFLIYLGETILFIRGVLNGSLKRPKITLKTVFLTLLSFIVAALFLGAVFKAKDLSQPALLLGFDILAPIFISIIVLLFQPFFVLIRNNTLRKARLKMQRIKSLSGLKVIAITGSYGKTSTKEFLSTILAKKYKVLKTSEHQNSEVGIAKCILNDLKPSHQIFIAEVGAYNKGKVREVCSMLKPKMGIVTGVNQQHLALFGSLDNLLSAEGGGELADILPGDGLLVVNGDNRYCINLYKKYNKPKKVYSLQNKVIDSDIWAEDITVHKDEISFLAIDKSGQTAHFGVKVLGKQNVQNLLGAILVANELGMSFEEISEACRNIKEEQAGMTLTHGKYGINIVDSSYSSNPDGVFADLDYLSVFKGKRVVVMPCLIELGEKSPEIHEKIGRRIGEVCDLAIITSADNFKEIKSGFNETKRGNAKCLLCDKSKDIYSTITIFCKSGDAVLLEGRVPAGLIELLIK